MWPTSVEFLFLAGGLAAKTNLDRLEASMSSLDETIRGYDKARLPHWFQLETGGDRPKRRSCPAGGLHTGLPTTGGALGVQILPRPLSKFSLAQVGFKCMRRTVQVNRMLKGNDGPPRTELPSGHWWVLALSLMLGDGWPRQPGLSA